MAIFRDVANLATSVASSCNYKKEQQKKLMNVHPIRMLFNHRQSTL